MFNSVDLPNPDGPMSETKSPCSILNEMPFSTCTGTAPRWKSFTKSLTSMMAAIAFPLESRSPAGRGAAGGRCRRCFERRDNHLVSVFQSARGDLRVVAIGFACRDHDPLLLLVRVQGPDSFLLR